MLNCALFCRCNDNSIHHINDVLRLAQCKAAQWNWWKDLAHWLLEEHCVCVCVRLPLLVGCCIITDSPEIYNSRFSSQDLSSDWSVYVHYGASFEKLQKHARCIICGFFFSKGSHFELCVFKLSLCILSVRRSIVWISVRLHVWVILHEYVCVTASIFRPIIQRFWYLAG